MNCPTVIFNLFSNNSRSSIFRPLIEHAHMDESLGRYKANRAFFGIHKRNENRNDTLKWENAHKVEPHSCNTFLLIFCMFFRIIKKAIGYSTELLTDSRQTNDDDYYFMIIVCDFDFVFSPFILIVVVACNCYSFNNNNSTWLQWMRLDECAHH